MITLQQLTITSFYVNERKSGKAFGSLESLKKHQLHHGNMKFCVVCAEQSSLLPQTYQVTKPCICKTKNLFVHIQNAVENIKKQSLITIITTDTNKIGQGSYR